MEQQLYLLRHAEAEPWSPLGNDFSRPLSVSGKQHAKAVADWASEHLHVPDTVLCSPSKRACETLAPLLAKWPQLLSVTEYTDSLYNASPDMLITLAGDAFSYSQRLLMVGHNPGFQSLLIATLPPHDAAGIETMAPGTLGVIGFKQGFGHAVSKGCLLHLLTSRDLPL